MKKRVSYIIALLVIMTVSGCGSKDNAQKVDNSSKVQQEQKDKTNTDNSKATDQKDKIVQNPQETKKPEDAQVKQKQEGQVKKPSNSTSTKPTNNTNTKPPTIPVAPKPTPIATRPTKPIKPSTPTKPPVQEVKVTVSDIINKITDEVELPAMMNVKKEEIKDFYYINPDDIEEFVIKTPMMNVQATEMAIIKVKDIKNVESVKESVNKRVKDLEGIWEQYLPKQYELVENHILKSNGQYIILIIHEDAKKIEGIFDSFFKK